MNEIRTERKLKKYIIRIFILLIFTSSFYFLNYIYTLGSRNSRTIVLDKKSFVGTDGDEINKKLQVGNVSSYDADYIIMEPKIAENNKIVFKTLSGNSYIGISIFDMESKKNNTILAKYDSNINNLYETNDTNKVVYIEKSESNGETRTYLQDIYTNRIDKIYEGALTSALFIDDNRIVGIADNSIIIKELNTGKEEKLMNFDDSTTNMLYKNYKNTYNLFMTKDRKILYAIEQGIRKENETYLSIKAINIDSKEITELKIKGSVYNVIPLNDGNFIFSGSVDGNSGIFIYNMANSTYKILKSGNIYEVKLTKDEDKISYISSDVSSNNNEVHVALFDKDKIELDTMIYRNAQYGNEILWTNEGNNLFYINSNNGKSRIYRFSINK
ncbi:hypothetical protein [Clostridium sp. 'White wine YQ']|uniref:hypothetical protein n=1 Tax=Clostridium sp. 'White wine YQ' TaxID=3027474 RepID=UPI0023653CFA|nr:hypothetical protein [Clostridium sp. 'White wine YQ']MDD7793593.1 hypothetical protein [Clostridium sp. 'White wine YQ']